MKICTVPECCKKVQARGWCSTHYWQNYVGRVPGEEGQRQRSARLRAEAKAQGRETYETGLPCPKGHVAPRRLCGHCVACFAEDSRKRYLENPERSRKATAKWTEKNRERAREAVRKWDSENRERKNEHRARRRAAELNAMPSWADRKAIRRIYAQARALGMHVDHIVPLQGKNVCGLHVEANLQLLPPVENLSKSNRFDATGTAV